MSEYIVRMPSDMPYEIRAELNAWYVNSEPIVRCRDCAWYEAREYRRHCDRTGSFQIESDGFCKWGERKEE